jgi:ElaB/YqjD/DUF883 family membrane-anchored ribosome-binding protein
MFEDSRAMAEKRAETHALLAQLKAQDGKDTSIFASCSKDTWGLTRVMAEHPWANAGVSFGLGVGTGVALTAMSSTVQGMVGLKPIK